MKKIIVGLLELCLCIALCACGCKHKTWQDASCENPKACVDCGITEGEALGHNWIQPSCTTPKTCDRCGLTKGEALGHSFTLWEIEGEDQYRGCSVCGTEERKAIDRAEICAQLIPGFWDTLYVKKNLYDDFKMNADSLKNFGLAIRFVFEEDGTGARMNVSNKGTENREDLTWKFISYQDDIYTIEILVDISSGTQRREISYYANGSEEYDGKIVYSSGGYHIMEKD